MKAPVLMLLFAAVAVFAFAQPEPRRARSGDVEEVLHRLAVLEAREGANRGYSSLYIATSCRFHAMMVFFLLLMIRLRNFHLRLNDFLVAEEQRDPGKNALDLRPWRKLPRRELPGQTLAILDRIRWLEEHPAALD